MPNIIPEANGHMWRDARHVHDFLRAYFHAKSGDWPGNTPFELGSWAAEQLARMPDYYIMPLALGMAETVAPSMPSRAVIEACTWLTERELSFYSEEYAYHRFSGGIGENARLWRDFRRSLIHGQRFFNRSVGPPHTPSRAVA